jgi:hypothetical protein
VKEALQQGLGTNCKLICIADCSELVVNEYTDELADKLRDKKPLEKASQQEKAA